MRRKYFPQLCLALSPFALEIEEDYEDITAESFKEDLISQGHTPLDDKRTERYVAYQNELNRKMRSTIQLYESHLDQAIYAKDVAVPFKKLLDHIDEIDEVVEQNGSFDNDSYDLYLNEQLGTVKWDTIEW